MAGHHHAQRVAAYRRAHGPHGAGVAQLAAQEVLGRKLEMFDRSIDVHISSLRKKLGHHIGEVERIKTIRGIGYMYSCLSEPN